MNATPAEASRSRAARYLPLLAMVVFSVLVAVTLLLAQEPLEGLGDWGYAGAFVAMLVNNATIVLPAAGQLIVAGLSASLNPVLLGVVGGIGGTIGELTGYVLGVTGRRIVSAENVNRRLRLIPRRLFGPTLFLFAATPLPFDVAGIAAGTVRFPVWWFLFWVGAGKILNTIAIAVAARYTIAWLQRVFELGG